MTTKIKIEYFPPDSLKPNPWNSNRVGPEMEERIEASIREFGFIKPIVVRRLETGELQILGGEHRTRKACEMGIDQVPVVVLEGVDDKRAKALGLIDNGRYGEDDALKLSSILNEIGTDLLEVMPYDDEDLAGIFASSKVDLDDLGFTESEDNGSDLPDLSAPRKTITHELMRFKVPIEDRDTVDKFIQQVVKSKGLASEDDSMVAAGMALVEIIKAAREVI